MISNSRSNVPQTMKMLNMHRIRVSYEASAAGHTGAQVLESILAELG